MLIGRHFGNVWKMLLMLQVILLSIRIQAQTSTREIDGSVSYKIETKSLTIAEAQNYINRKEDIPLKVSVIFRGKWVDLFDNGFIATIKESSFSYGIAQTDGEFAALETNAPAAWMLANGGRHCVTDDGTPLNAPTLLLGMGVNVETPLWEDQPCPSYAYGLGFTGSRVYKSDTRLVRGEDADGPYYEEPMFYIYFKLKRLETVYVRGIDILGSHQTEQDGSFTTTSGETVLNIGNPSVPNSPYCYWPGCPSPDESADWTQAPADYYGGVIPGGIFIEQVPELTQFERSSMA